ncbi:MAG: hypothetical protein JNG86_07275 [Verrucomicrobiaceae bacterium]|nr:hypothetical protein [Verrucomicrobiaceae bacterium]
MDAALPMLGQELAPLNEKADPSFEDARQVVASLTAAASRLAGAERRAMDELIGQLKQPFIAELAYQRLVAQAPQYQAALDSGRKKLESIEKNPPRRVGGAVDVGFKDRMVQDANAAIIQAEKGLEEIKLAAGQLVAQLGTTNSTAAAYLREARRDVAQALAGSMFAIASRHHLRLDFEPALSYVWVRMSKLSPVQRSVEQDRAKRMLVGYVALHEGAKAVSGFGADAFYQSAKSGDLASSLLSFFILQEGLEQQARLDKTIDSCLEVVCYQPEPGDYPAKARLALNQLLKPITGKSATERFAENVVHDALAAVEPRLATPQISGLLATVLLEGAKLATAP